MSELSEAIAELDEVMHDMVLGGWRIEPILARLRAAQSEQDALVAAAYRDAQRDINNLLALLLAHQENTGEFLEPDDASVLNHIEEKWRDEGPSPVHARAALEAIVQKARKEVLEEAAQLLNSYVGK